MSKIESKANKLFKNIIQLYTDNYLAGIDDNWELKIENQSRHIESLSDRILYLDFIAEYCTSLMFNTELIPIALYKGDTKDEIQEKIKAISKIKRFVLSRSRSIERIAEVEENFELLEESKLFLTGMHLPYLQIEKHLIKKNYLDYEMKWDTQKNAAIFFTAVLDSSLLVPKSISSLTRAQQEKKIRKFSLERYGAKIDKEFQLNLRINYVKLKKYRFFIDLIKEVVSKAGI